MALQDVLDIDLLEKLTQICDLVAEGREPEERRHAAVVEKHIPRIFLASIESRNIFSET